MDAHQACRILDVEYGASPEEIKSSYRKLALELHPDKRASNGAGKRFQEINEAYNILKDGPKSPGGVPSRGRKGGVYGQKADRQRQGFAGTGSRWGPPPGQKAPEQDWGKYTREFEDENPGFWKEYERKFWEEYDRTINAGGRNGEHEKAKEPKTQPDLFVDVDPSLCIACQSCETMAPNVFHIDRESGMNPKSRVINMKGAGINKITNAAETCPTKAITVENKDTGERVYPL